MYKFYENNKEPIQNLLILSGGILAFFLFFRYLFPIFLPFLFGWLFSLMFLPLANKLEKHGVPRWLGAFAAILLFLTSLWILGYFVSSQLSTQLKSFLADIPYYVDKVQTVLVDFWARLDLLFADLPDIIGNITTYVREELLNILLSFAQSSGSTAAITAVPKIIVGFLIALFTSYFLTKDTKLIHEAYQTHVAPLFGLTLDSTKKELTRSLWGYMKTQLILMLYIFIICVIGLHVLNSPYALLLSVAIAIIDAVPFFGSGFILWPGALIQFILGNTGLAVGYLAVYAIVQIVRQLMQPKILGTQIGMHPLLTLFAMYFGYKCMGFWGLILGPIIAVILRTLLRIHKQHKNAKRHMQEDSLN